jgi:rhamnose transport system permease protein
MSAPTYPAYAHPLWRRLLVSREAGVIALVIVIWMWGYSNFRTSATRSR